VGTGLTCRMHGSRAQAGKPWRVSIQHPLERSEDAIAGVGRSGDDPQVMRPSGTYERGEHIVRTDDPAESRGRAVGTVARTVLSTADGTRHEALRDGPRRRGAGRRGTLGRSLRSEAISPKRHVAKEPGFGRMRSLGLRLGRWCRCRAPGRVRSLEHKQRTTRTPGRRSTGA